MVRPFTIRPLPVRDREQVRVNDEHVVTVSVLARGAVRGPRQRRIWRAMFDDDKQVAPRERRRRQVPQPQSRPDRLIFDL